jgi:hypothetical protein
LWFFFFFFWDKVSQNYLLGLASNLDFLISASESWVAMIIGVSHWCLAHPNSWEQNYILHFKMADTLLFAVLN